MPWGRSPLQSRAREMTETGSRSRPLFGGVILLYFIIALEVLQEPERSVGRQRRALDPAHRWPFVYDLRRVGSAAGGGWRVWGPGLCSGSAHPRDRHPHGAGRESEKHALAGSWRRIQADAGWHGVGLDPGVWRRAPAHQHAGTYDAMVPCATRYHLRPPLGALFLSSCTSPSSEPKPRDYSAELLFPKAVTHPVFDQWDYHDLPIKVFAAQGRIRFDIKEDFFVIFDTNTDEGQLVLSRFPP